MPNDSTILERIVALEVRMERVEGAMVGMLAESKAISETCHRIEAGISLMKWIVPTFIALSLAIIGVIGLAFGV